jgi:hypothetical protein
MWQHVIIDSRLPDLDQLDVGEVDEVVWEHGTWIFISNNDTEELLHR